MVHFVYFRLRLGIVILLDVKWLKNVLKYLDFADETKFTNFVVWVKNLGVFSENSVKNRSVC